MDNGSEAGSGCRVQGLGAGFPNIRDIFLGRYEKDYSIFGSIRGSPLFEETIMWFSLGVLGLLQFKGSEI